MPILELSYIKSAKFLISIKKNLKLGFILLIFYLGDQLSKILWMLSKAKLKYSYEWNADKVLENFNLIYSKT